MARCFKDFCQGSNSFGGERWYEMEKTLLHAMILFSWYMAVGQDLLGSFCGDESTCF